MYCVLIAGKYYVRVRVIDIFDEQF